MTMMLTLAKNDNDDGDDDDDDNVMYELLTKTETSKKIKNKIKLFSNDDNTLGYLSHKTENG